MTFSFEDRVRVLNDTSPFHLKTGKVVGKCVGAGLARVYTIRMDELVSLSSSDAGFSTNIVVFPERFLIAAKTVSSIALDRIYARYMRVRLEALSEILQLIKFADKLEDVSDTIIDYMHKVKLRAMPSPLDVIELLPEESKVPSNELTDTLFTH